MEATEREPIIIHAKGVHMVDPIEIVEPLEAYANAESTQD